MALVLKCETYWTFDSQKTSCGRIPINTVSLFYIQSFHFTISNKRGVKNKQLQLLLHSLCKLGMQYDCQKGGNWGNF